MKMNWHLLLVMACAGSLLAACGGAAGDEDQDGSLEEAPAVPLSDRLAYMQTHGRLRAVDAESPRNKANKHTFFSAASQGTVNTGKNFNSGNICMLSGVWGNFSDYITVAGVNVSQYTSGEWYLSADVGAAMSAVCTEPGVFRAPPSSVEWLSDEGWNGRRTDGTSTFSLWWGDAITFLTDVTGEFEGAGESVHISQSFNVATASVVSVRTQAETAFADTFIRGGARSFFLGNPANGWLVKLYGYNNGAWVRGNVTNAGTWQFTVGESGGFSSYWLAPYDSAVCFLTRVSGDLNTSSDKVAVTTKNSNFYLAATAKAIGAARCLAYDQR
jgi:hypothetical protein